MQTDVFLSYSHHDEKLHQELIKHLKPLEYEGLIHSWHDRKILPGSNFEAEISQELDAANIILLLVSPDFISSDYCWGKEMKRAIARHEARTARVIPIILRPVDWQSTPFGKLLALPTDGKPVTTWVNRDEGFLDVVRGIRAAVGHSGSSPERPVPKPSIYIPAADYEPIQNSAQREVIPEETSGRPAIVHLERGARYSDKLRLYKVWVDGSIVARIGDGQSITFTFSPGLHSINLSMDWYGSNILVLPVQPGEDIYLECGIASMIKAIWSPRSYLYLRRTK
jgi:hypothetical protein